MSRTKIKDVLTSEPTGYEVTVKGWVRSFRNNQFIALNDGSCLANLQVVVPLSWDQELLKKIIPGYYLSNMGTVQPSLGKGQKREGRATNLEYLGTRSYYDVDLKLKNRQ